MNMLLIYDNCSNNILEPDPARLEAARAEVARTIMHHPQEMIALLQNASSSLQPRGTDQTNTAPLHQLEDVSSDDLAPLISIRNHHQSKQASAGVCTHKASNCNTIDVAGKSQVVSDRQKLAWEMTSLLQQADTHGASTGLNRQVCWTGKASVSVDSEPVPSTAGNTANAELAAKGRASEVSTFIVDLVLDTISFCRS